MSKPTGRAPCASDRRGYVLIVTMVCLALVAVILTSLLTTSVRTSRQVRQDERRLQADWLAQSAIDRAVRRLRNETDYAGETWDVSAKDLGGPDAGSARIVVMKPKDEPDQRTITVEAHYPADSVRTVRRTRTLTFDLEPNADTPDQSTGA